MKDFLITLSKMYNISYSNILLLKDQKKDVTSVFHKEKLKEYGINLKEGELPLKVIKRIKTEEGFKFKKDEVYDISQTNATGQRVKPYKKEYIETILKGMCSRRGIKFIPNNQIENIENIVMNIRDNTRQGNLSNYNVDSYARQTSAEIDATVFGIAKRINVNTRNYNLKDVCLWGVNKDARTLKESLKYMQKFTNYFIKDFNTQEKIQNIESENQEEME